MKKIILYIAIIASLNAFTQNIEIISFPDTVFINANGLNQLVEISFANKTSNAMIIAVSETPIVSLISVNDTIGFFANASPFPGDPETLQVVAGDTMRAFYYISPNGAIGSQTINICFWDFIGMDDSTCNTLTIITTLNATQDEKTMIDFQVYPNPCVNDLIIETDLDIKIQIYNIIGERIFVNTTNIDNNLYQINMESVKPGIYFIQIMQNGLLIGIKKVIKK